MRKVELIENSKVILPTLETFPPALAAAIGNGDLKKIEELLAPILHEESEHMSYGKMSYLDAFFVFSTSIKRPPRVGANSNEDDLPLMYLNLALKMGADPNLDVNWKSREFPDYGFSAGLLFQAIQQCAQYKNSDLTLIETLINRGASPDEAFSRLAQLPYRKDIIVLLIDHGADVQKMSDCFDKKVKMQELPYVKEVLNVLLMSGLGLNTLTPHFMDDQMYTPLSHALRSGQCILAKALVIRGADLHRGVSPPWFYAVWPCQSFLLPYLFEMGAKINTLDDEGNTALHRWIGHFEYNGKIAIPDEALSTLIFLLDKGIDVNAQNNVGETAQQKVMKEDNPLAEMLSKELAYRSAALIDACTAKIILDNFAPKRL